MVRTHWWKKRHTRSSSFGSNTPPTTPTDTSCTTNVKEDKVQKEDSSPPSHQPKKICREQSNLNVKLISPTNKIEDCDETTELLEEDSVDENLDLPEPPLVGDVTAGHQLSEERENKDTANESKDHDESEAVDNQPSLGDDGLVQDEEVPSIKRTDTEDSGEGSIGSSAAGTQGSSAHATIAMTVATSKTDKTDYTDYTDDGILRDDEGNPVDLAEAEENMLRDDEGNIIDPKTLVTKESFLDLCCECDEYEDHIHTIGANSAQDQSEIDEDTYVRFTIEAVVSEMITCLEENAQSELITEPDNVEVYQEPLKEGCNTESTATDIEEADEDEDPSEASDNVEPTLGRVTRSRRNGNVSGRNRSRHIRWGRAPPQQGADDTVHIMFNNTLSTLVEVASGSVDEDSTEETEDEKSHVSHKSTRSEKFFKARWNYSLQVMRSEESTAQLIDARDEIDDMIRPKERIPDDRSVCSDEGTI